MLKKGYEQEHEILGVTLDEYEKLEKEYAKLERERDDLKEANKMLSKLFKDEQDLANELDHKYENLCNVYDDLHSDYADLDKAHNDLLTKYESLDKENELYADWIKDLETESIVKQLVIDYYEILHPAAEKIRNSKDDPSTIGPDRL